MTLRLTQIGVLAATFAFNCGGGDVATHDKPADIPRPGDTADSDGDGDRRMGDSAAGDTDAGSGDTFSAGISWPQDASLRAEYVGRTTVGLLWPAAIGTGNVSEYRLSQTGAPDTVVPGDVRIVSVTGLAAGSTYTFSVSAIGMTQEETSQALVLEVTTTTLPPDPADVAPAQLPSDTHLLVDTHRFLIDGDDPVQVNVENGAIEDNRFAVVRGKIMTVDSEPLPGVTVTIVQHPEYGQTTTRADGMFDIAVNGGGIVCLNFELAGYAPAQRDVFLAWNHATQLLPVIMVAYDVQATTIALDSTVADMQIGMGSLESDSDGERQAVILFPEGTSATMHMADGSSTALTSLTVRATEFTVGPYGPAAMPATLPPTSAYTYAVEFSIDEAVAAGATTVTFDRVLPFYVENFLNFPAGAIVPVGYYDREMGLWVPSPNGVVIELISESDMDGVPHANLDVDGDGIIDDQAALDTIGISLAERQKLAMLYNAGDSLWRVPVEHFTPYDCNWPALPDSPDAEPPFQESDDQRNLPGSPNGGPIEKDPCNEDNSILACQNQSLGQSLKVSGTPFHLRYESARMPGDTRERTLSLPLLGDTLKGGISQVYYQVVIAGQVMSGLVDPTPNLTVDIMWDGLDATTQGPVYGAAMAQVYAALIYPGHYATPQQFSEAFGSYPTGTILTGSSARNEVWLGKQFTTTLRSNYTEHIQHLHGWTLDIHHSLDVKSAKLRLGTGRMRDVDILGHVITDLNASPGQRWDSCDMMDQVGDPALKVEDFYTRPRNILSLPDGSLALTSDCIPYRIIRFHTDGRVSLLAGGNVAGGEPVDDIHTVVRGADAVLDAPQKMALGPDGSIYFRQTSATDARIRKLTLKGIVTTVAGTGVPGFSGDGGPATAAQIEAWGQIAVGPDGSVYLSETNGARIRKVSTQGIITTIAGGCGTTCTGGLAINSSLNRPAALAVDKAGVVYISSRRRISRIETNGTLTNVAGDGNCIPTTPGALAATGCVSSVRALTFSPQGLLHFVNSSQIFGLSESGRFRHIAVPAIYKPFSSGTHMLATLAYIASPEDISFDPDGSMYVASGNTHYYIRKISRNPFAALEGNQVVVLNEKGDRYFIFDGGGRHLATHNLITREPIYQFEYATEGLLAAVTGSSGERYEIERNLAGAATAIVSPDLTRTELEVSGDWLNAVSYSSGTRYDFTYDEGGLLKTLTDAFDRHHAFDYDQYGRLSSDLNANGKLVTLDRTLTNSGYVVTKTVGHTHATTDLVSTYEYQVLGNGAQNYINTDAKGAVTSMIRAVDGVESITYPSGATFTKWERVDHSTGSAAPFLYQTSATTPAGKTSVTTYTQTHTSETVAGTEQTTSTTRTRTENGFVSTVEVDYANRTILRTTPQGAVSTTLFDGTGRVISYQPDTAVSPSTVVYAEDGRLQSVDKGFNHWTYDWQDAAGELVITDALGRETAHQWDAMGRIAQTTLASGSVLNYGYDARGRRNSFTAPNNATHQVTYQPRGRYASFGEADVAPLWSMEFGLDHTPVSRQWAQRSMTFDYDGTRRLQTVDYTEAAITYTYNATTESIEQIHWSRKNSTDQQTVDFTFDGILMTGVDYSGAATGSFTAAYSNRLLPTSITATIGGSTTSTAYDYDGDPRLVIHEPFVISRNGPASKTSHISHSLDAGFSLNFLYDSAGRVTTKSVNVSGATYALSFTYDAAGRVSHRMELADNATSNFAYLYDVENQLTTVMKNDILVEQYSYDVNGNRSGELSAGGVFAGTGVYAVNDQVASFANDTFVYDEDGFMTHRNGDRFLYSARGELLEVALESGDIVSYTYDGLGRRTTRSDVVGTSQFMYADPTHLYLVSHAVTPSGELHRYYYDDGGSIYAIDVAGVWHYVASDQVGSPRSIYASDGTIVRAIERDQFGRILSDTNPDWFLPIGFAGGLEDASTGLVRFVFRDYLVRAGRWSARDPSLYNGGDMNLFRYVNNDPVSHKDPLGLWCVGFSGYVGAGGGAKTCRDKNGQWVICTEGGAGIGASIDVSFEDKNPSTDKGNIKSGVGLGCGPVSTELEAAEAGPCDYEVHWLNNLFGLKGDVNLTDLEGSNLSTSITDGLAESLSKGVKCGPSAKLVYEDCEVVPF